MFTKLENGLVGSPEHSQGSLFGKQLNPMSGKSKGKTSVRGTTKLVGDEDSVGLFEVYSVLPRLSPRVHERKLSSLCLLCSLSGSLLLGKDSLLRFVCM